MSPTFGKRLLATGSLGEDLLALRDGLSTESDTLLSVEDGTLPDEGLDATGTAIDLVEGDLVDDLGTVLPAKRRNNVSDANKVKRDEGLLSARFQAMKLDFTYFRRALICSIFSGRSSAKRSFRDYIEEENPSQLLSHLIIHTFRQSLP